MARTHAIYMSIKTELDLFKASLYIIQSTTNILYHMASTQW